MTIAKKLSLTATARTAHTRSSTLAVDLMTSCLVVPVSPPPKNSKLQTHARQATRDVMSI